MGDTKRKRRKFAKPKKRWDKARIETEREVKKKYGLKNKKELWRTETFLRNKKDQARKLLALELEIRLKREKELIDSLAKYGLVDSKATVDNVLGLSTESLLERRLQTIVWRKGLAGTIIQARQFVSHGHIAVSEKKLTVPGYLVKTGEEEKIGYYGKPMVVEEKKKREIKKELTDKEKMKNEFEESKPEEKQENEEKKEEGEKTVKEKKHETKEKAGKKEPEGKKAAKEKAKKSEKAAGKKDIEQEEEEAMEEEIKETGALKEPEEAEKEKDEPEEDVEEKEETEEGEDEQFYS